MKLAIISDIHEDYIYLEQTLKKIENIGCNEIACLGDIVGYSVPHYFHIDTRNANKCIELISSNCKYVVAGNHDQFALRKLPENCSEYNLPDNWYELSFDKRKELSKGKVWLYEDTELSALLNDKSKEWLSNLPEFVIIDFSDYKIFLSHFICPDITGFTTAYLEHISNFSLHLKFLKKFNTNLCFFGHIHTSELLELRNNNHKFSKNVIINTEIVGIGIPAIVRNKYFSGFAVFDTSKNCVELYSV